MMVRKLYSKRTLLVAGIDFTLQCLLAVKPNLFKYGISKRYYNETIEHTGAFKYV